jgi:hypothetical protein
LETEEGKESDMKMLSVRASLLGLAFFLVVSSVAYAAQTISVTGELIDTFCYASMGAKGESHRQCAIGCVKKGIPAGILQDGTNKVYVLLPSKDASPLPQSVIDNMARKVTITGKAYITGGTQFLTVESLK